MTGAQKGVNVETSIGYWEEVIVIRCRPEGLATPVKAVEKAFLRKIIGKGKNKSDEAGITASRQGMRKGSSVAPGLAAKKKTSQSH